MNDWSHGYDVSVGYSHGFYREMAPDWLDLCAALGGRVGSRDRRSASFRYLELGSGQGVGLCLLAAANPQAEFVGIDFMRDHIVHSRAMANGAGLTNVRFVEADFLDLAGDWPADFGSFDYVTLHGIYTWLSEAVRAALVDCLGHATRDGSLVYLGYNSQPGWLAMMPFQHLTRELKRATGEGGQAAIDNSLELFQRLQAGNAITFQVQPALRARLEEVKAEDPNYLIQEYLNEGWRPMWHSQVARELEGIGLAFVASATIAENLLPAMLPPALKEPVVEQADAMLRQDLQDFILNQTFRRDIFRRGRAAEAGESDPLADIRLRLLAPPAPGRDIRVETSFGNITLQPVAYQPVLEALTEGPKPFAELAALPISGDTDLARILPLMLESPAIAIEAARPAEPGAAAMFNALLARGASEGAPYRHLAATAFGSAIPATEPQMLLLDCWFENGPGSDSRVLADGLASRAGKLGLALRDPAELAKAFVSTSLPRLRQFGCVA